MYYVDEKQIERRLAFLPVVIEALQELREGWRPQDKLHAFAEERIVHLAIESVTDIGSLMIDGFLMREASSYEDIIRVLSDERVFPEQTGEVLSRLVMWRKPLVQEYDRLDAAELHRLAVLLPDALLRFSEAVAHYLQTEL